MAWRWSQISLLSLCLLVLDSVISNKEIQHVGGYIRWYRSLFLSNVKVQIRAVQVRYGSSIYWISRSLQLTALPSQYRTKPHSLKRQQNGAGGQRVSTGPPANRFLRNIPRNCCEIIPLLSHRPYLSEEANLSRWSWVKQSSFWADTCPSQSSVKTDQEERWMWRTWASATASRRPKGGREWGRVQNNGDRKEDQLVARGT